MKKGFTLIELLAVIVILAIIATIATPIVLSIIEDTKNSATLRNAEYYLDAVEQSIARKSLNIGGSYSPNECVIQTDGNLICDGEVEVIVEVNGKKPNSGTITFDKGKINDITLNIENKVVTQNEKGEFVFGQTNELGPNTLSGTWKFNDVLSEPSIDHIQVLVNFTAGGYNFDTIVVGIDSDYQKPFMAYLIHNQPGSVSTEAFVYGTYAEGNDPTTAIPAWDINYGDVAKTITFITAQEVPAEFYDWFTANAVEQKQINGVWTFNDSITSIPYEVFELSAGYYGGTRDQGTFLETHGADIEPISFNQDGVVLSILRISPSTFFGDMFDEDGPTVITEEVTVRVRVDAVPDGLDLDMSIGDEFRASNNPAMLANQEVDFGESQYVSIVFYNWLTENATKQVDS